MTMLKLPNIKVVSKVSKAQRAFFRAQSQAYRELLVAYDPLSTLSHVKKIARKYPNISEHSHTNIHNITIVKKLARKHYSLAWICRYKKRPKTYIATDDYIKGNELLKILECNYEQDYSLPNKWYTRIDASGLVFGGYVNWYIARHRVTWLEVVCIGKDVFYLAEYSTSPKTGHLSVNVEEHCCASLVEALQSKGKRKPLDHYSQGALPASISSYTARFTHTRAGVRHRLHSHWG